MAFTCDLSGKTALITGSSSGLGKHLAGTLARAGARVAITARRGDRLQQLAGQIREAGGIAEPIEMDMTDAANVRAGVDAAEAALGPIHILINNAGIAIQKPAQDFTDEDYDQLMGTNLKGAWVCAQAIGGKMIARGEGGKIVNISSLLALRPIPHLALYAMSKAAMSQMTRALALEWARNDIQVNAICPGYIETEMNAPHWRSEPGKRFMSKFPRRRVGQPDVLDGIVLLLCSSDSDFMTGSVIPIDDAQTMMG